MKRYDWYYDDMHENSEGDYYKVEEITLDDSRLSNVWGKSIYRLSLTAKDKVLKAKSIITIKAK